jgi:hypothetical protein
MDYRRTRRLGTCRQLESIIISNLVVRYLTLQEQTGYLPIEANDLFRHGGAVARRATRGRLCVSTVSIVSVAAQICPIGAGPTNRAIGNVTGWSRCTSS